MKGAISRKLRSPRGASMLLALLFLLICSMVTASILMAAVANAGKHRSNLEEHQIYLALSSAVSTLCDELNRSEYRGQYEYWEETEDITNDDEEVIETIILKYLRQLDGTYTHTSPATEDANLKNVLLNDFEFLFAEEISSALTGSGITIVDPKSGAISPHTLILTTATGTELDDTPVHITLEVKESYAIYVTAYLDGLNTYKVEAELTPKENKPTVSNLSVGTHDTEAMQWTLGWITILDVEEEGGAAGA